MTTFNTDNQSPVLYLYSGIPGSGKTTAAKKLEAELRADGTAAVRVNRDEIREHLFGFEYATSTPVPENEAIVSKFQMKLVHDYLEKNWVVISDDTNLTSRATKPLRAAAAKHGAEVIEVPIVVPVDVAKAQNRQRGAEGGRFVPEEIIDAMEERRINSQQSRNS